MSFFRQRALRRCRQAVAVGISGTMLLATGCRAQKPWPLWDAYAARSLDAQGRVIDHSEADHSTSEGEAYGMFFALVMNDRTRFDKILDWSESNLAQGDLTLHLPAWNWGKASDGSWHVLDPNSAADADLWMAYTLCEAGRLWHVERYSKLGSILAERIAREEVVSIPSVGTVLVPGSSGFHPSPTNWYVNPSYMPPALLQYFAHRDPGSPWGQVLASLPAVVQTSGGYAMDWMYAGQDTGIAPSASPGAMAALPQGQAAPVPVGSYDAIRVYLWAGLADGHTPHVAEELGVLRGMSSYLQHEEAPPLKVGPEGQTLDPNGPVGFSAAVVPYLDALGRKTEEKEQMDRVTALQDSKTGLYGKEGRYYDQNLVLFEDGWATSRFRFDAEGRLHLKWK
jgi:endo-1,4-beta-D-glucanase Y